MKLLAGCLGFAGFDRTLRRALDGGTYCLPASATILSHVNIASSCDNNNRVPGLEMACCHCDVTVSQEHI